ncbi:MAG: hypothetical protein P4L84_28080 [Isosphaeraceae bacterium]|nr:hypothetical protein [Isosphaeraceae bacterium]
MSDDESTRDDPDTILNELSQAKYQAIERCQYRTACRLAYEIKRKAKAARRLYPYVWALHTLTNSASDLLDPEQGVEAAVELIAVLESEDRARQIQPDIDQAEYERIVSQVSSCAYDNLGRSTAQARGYNSEGLHGTIAEGIQVCRRTGKLECINCFREYATDVSLAADDLDMALHHARHVVAHGNVREGFDRRWSGANEEAGVLLLAGQLDAAEAATRRAAELAETYHNPLRARLSNALRLETIRLLKGPQGASEGPGENAGDVASCADEYPALYLHQELLEALRSSIQGDHAAAIRRLTPWDRRLAERDCLHQWFEARLRLIAAYRLAGETGRLEALAKPLEDKARAARDWLTLRRLARLLDPGAPVSPIAPAAPLNTGQPAAPAAPLVETDEPRKDEPTPLRAPLESLLGRLAAAGEDPVARAAIQDDLLSLGAQPVTHPADAACMLHLAANVCDPPRAPAVWGWAQTVAAPFAREATVLNLLASLGNSLRSGEGSTETDTIGTQRIEELFRQSLDLDPNDFGNFARAAVYYQGAGQANEAERCLARCLRLDRSSPRAALWLAEIYNQSDRSHDALAVLDMALRAGSESPEIAWQAAVLAHSLRQFDMLLTYLDHFEGLVPKRPWVNYYRASGLLWLGRAEEALPALDEEARRSEGGVLHVQVLRTCAAAALGRSDEFRRHLSEVLETRLSDVDYLTHSGLVNLFSRLWEAAQAMPEGSPLLGELERLLLETGLAPNSLFEGPRRANAKAEGLSFYVCTLVQPLDDAWRGAPGCLAGEAEWTAYRVPWGILAADPDEAARTALAWQARCYPQPADVEEVQVQDEGYADHPGVVWQGLRSAVS